jgi:splicing suppressor protein 51
MESSNLTSETPICTACKKSEPSFTKPLKRCGKCKITLYCSRDCQQGDWKNHKKVCNKNKDTGAGGGGGSSSSAHGQADGEALNPISSRLEGTFKLFSMASPTSDRGNIFNNSVKPGYLSRLPEARAFAAIIDSYRLRVEDEYTFRGDASGLYGDEDPLSCFRDYLDQAEQCGEVLPPWWNQAKRRACENQAMRKSEWSYLGCPVEKPDIQEHYGDNLMPMRLRMLAERVTGSHVC